MGCLLSPASCLLGLCKILSYYTTGAWDVGKRSSCVDELRYDLLPTLMTIVQAAWAMSLSSRISASPIEPRV